MSEAMVCMVIEVVILLFLIVIACVLKHVCTRIDDLERNINYQYEKIDEWTDNINDNVCDNYAVLQQIQSTIEESEYEATLSIDCDKCECEEEECCAFCNPDCEDAEEIDIHLISKNQWLFEHNEHNAFELKYDANSDKLVYCNAFDGDTELNDPEDIIGDGLKFFGVMSGEDNVVYIRNHIYKCDFKVVKM